MYFSQSAQAAYVGIREDLRAMFNPRPVAVGDEAYVDAAPNSPLIVAAMRLRNVSVDIEAPNIGEIVAHGKLTPVPMTPDQLTQVLNDLYKYLMEKARIAQASPTYTWTSLSNTETQTAFALVTLPTDTPTPSMTFTATITSTPAPTITMSGPKFSTDENDIRKLLATAPATVGSFQFTSDATQGSPNPAHFGIVGTDGYTFIVSVTFEESAQGAYDYMRSELKGMISPLPVAIGDEAYVDTTPNSPFVLAAMRLRNIAVDIEAPYRGAILAHGKRTPVPMTPDQLTQVLNDLYKYLMEKAVLAK
jgi:hypothetical protein